MSAPLKVDPVPLYENEDGAIRVRGTRINLEQIVYAFDDGASAEAIVEDFPTLELADVYATIAYILRHRAEVDAYLARVEAESEEIRQLIERDYPTEELRRRLRARMAGRAEAGR